MASIPKLSLASFALLWVTACANEPEWSAVNPDQLGATCEGEVVTLTLNPEGVSYVVVAPDDTALLAPGQDTLTCAVDAAGYNASRPILDALTVGDRVRVSGYWVARRTDDTVEHQINQITSIDRLP